MFLPSPVPAADLGQAAIGRRNRAFEAPEMIDAFNKLEGELATPTPNTH
jgi:hypothetical protein